MEDYPESDVKNKKSYKAEIVDKNEAYEPPAKAKDLSCPFATFTEANSTIMQVDKSGNASISRTNSASYRVLDVQIKADSILEQVGGNDKI